MSTPRTNCEVNRIASSGVDWHHSAALMATFAKKLELELDKLAATEALVLQMTGLLKVYLNRAESRLSSDSRSHDQTEIDCLRALLKATPFSALFEHMKPATEALIKAADLLKQSLQSHNAALQDADPDSQFYGEDIVTPPVLRQIEQAIIHCQKCGK